MVDFFASTGKNDGRARQTSGRKNRIGINKDVPSFKDGISDEEKKKARDSNLYDDSIMTVEKRSVVALYARYDRSQ